MAEVSPTPFYVNSDGDLAHEFWEGNEAGGIEHCGAHRVDTLLLAGWTPDSHPSSRQCIMKHERPHVVFQSG